MISVKIIPKLWRALSRWWLRSSYDWGSLNSGWQYYYVASEGKDSEFGLIRLVRMLCSYYLNQIASNGKLVYWTSLTKQSYYDIMKFTDKHKNVEK